MAVALVKKELNEVWGIGLAASCLKGGHVFFLDVSQLTFALVLLDPEGPFGFEGFLF